MKYKLLKKFWHKDELTGTNVYLARIEIPHRPTKVKDITFPMNTLYDVPISDINDSRKWMEPLDNEDYNVKRSYMMYRKKMGLLSPEIIKRSRKALGLSQSEVASVLGLSVSALSKIENNRLIQSLSQDTRLRCLTNWIMFESLIKAHLPMIRNEHIASVKINDLVTTVTKIDTLKAERGMN